MEKLLALMTLTFLATSSFAENIIVYSSAYTDLAHDCKWQYLEKNLQEGQDNALICKGAGEYEALIDFSMDDSYLHVLKTNTVAFTISTDIRLADYKKGKIEWRLANEKPFAIITRTKLGAKKTLLSIHGLHGFDVLSATANNNANARTIADKFYDSNIKR